LKVKDTKETIRDIIKNTKINLTIQIIIYRETEKAREETADLYNEAHDNLMSQALSAYKSRLRKEVKEMLTTRIDWEQDGKVISVLKRDEVLALLKDI
jgi:hypothetical protein